LFFFFFYTVDYELQWLSIHASSQSGYLFIYSSSTDLLLMLT
jgi:hypothetical protein